MEPITVTTQLTKSDLQWNLIYWWHRIFWKRFFCWLVATALVSIYLVNFADGDYQRTGTLDVKQSIIVWFLTFTTLFPIIYLIDYMFYVGERYLRSKKYKDVLFSNSQLTFSADAVCIEKDNSKSVLPYDHFDSVYFYKRHVILKFIGLRLFHIFKWTDVPENRRSDLKNLLTEKIKGIQAK